MASGSSLRIPARRWVGALRAFVPQRVGGEGATANDTVVQITSALPSSFVLVLTFVGGVSGATGTSRVAALQDVSANVPPDPGRDDVSAGVRIDLGRDAALYWMASALKRGSLEPNQAWYPYASDEDNFRVKLSQDIVLSHDAGGFDVPHYDSDTYSVFVGFGLVIEDWAYWAYSVPASPGQQGLVVRAQAYALMRSNGAEQIGDPVDATLDTWSIPRGGAYSLTFDGRGQGTLTKIDDG